MGCAPSKRIEATLATDVYRPAPTSFALFDINAIEEPWLKASNEQQQQQQEKPTHVPAPILEKLNTFELASKAPHSWSEVSKALEDLKPILQSPKPPSSKPEKAQHNPLAQDSTIPMKQPPRKSVSFRTLEELDSKLSSKPTESKKTESMTNMKKPEFKTSSELESRPVVTPPIDSGGIKPIRENSFIVRDRLEREGKGSTLDRNMKSRRDPLSEYPEKCPPGGADSVVLYTTTLRGVRRTFDDCNRARSVIEGHRVAIDERDVSLHGGFLNELRELLGEGSSVPRLFVKGRYIGGVDEVVELNESGRLGRLLNSVGIGKGLDRRDCEGCGGARFVPCLECGGSCKVLIGDKKERCSKCNENGLVQCPICH